MGRVHLRCFNELPGIDIRKLCDVSTSALEAARAAAPAAVLSTDVADVAEDPEVDLVSVCLPHVDHVPVASLLLEAGKYVVLEKPIATTMEDASRLLDVAARYPGRLVVKSYLRHSRPLQILREAVRDGTIGTPRLVSATFASFRRDADVPAWRLEPATAGGGALLDVGVHLIDVLHWMLGTEDDVRASLQCDERGMDLDAVVILSFRSGPLAVIGVTQRARVDRPSYRIEALGDGGRAVTETMGDGALRLVIEATGAARSEVVATDWWESAHRAALAAYLGHAMLGEPLGEPPSDAAANVATVDAAMRAAAHVAVPLP